MNKKLSLSRLWISLHEHIQRHPRLTLVIAGVGLIVAATLITMALLYQEPERVAAPEPTPPPPKPKPIYHSRLTGEKVAKKSSETAAVTAIMIENSPAARPQSGLRDAGVVYEAIAEGGITRFLALYQNDKPSLIGPVRSLRMYFVDWLAPYDASVAHVGGSAAALREIRNGKYRDIDQFFNAGSYWRAADRFAPHNVYTNFKKLNALNQAKGYVTSDFVGFTRTDQTPAETPTARQIAVTFSSAAYNTSYRYQKPCNCYTRSLGGAAHVDREEGPITPKVVVALHVDMRHVMEDGYREAITTTGTGNATVFQNGTATKVTWRKTSRGAQLEFIDKKGKPFPLVRGQTWIAAVPNGQGKVSWK